MESSLTKQSGTTSHGVHVRACHSLLMAPGFHPLPESSHVLRYTAANRPEVLPRSHLSAEDKKTKDKSSSHVETVSLWIVVAIGLMQST